MAFVLKALFLLQLAVVCLQLSGVSAHTVRDRCWCDGTLSRRVPKELIKEFKVLPKRTYCGNDEIILTLKSVNPETGENEERCLSPETLQANNLQTCWRKHKHERRTTVNISECGVFNHKKESA